MHDAESLARAHRFDGLATVADEEIEQPNFCRNERATS